MIDFRYHLVSIVAIFLALTLGLVVGSTTLRSSVAAGLKDQAGRLNKEAQALRVKERQQEQLASYNNQVVGGLAPQTVEGRLKGQSVVFLEAPGADDQMRSKLVDMVKTAGATVSGFVTLQDRYLDQSQVTTLNELVERLKTATQFPAEADPYDKAANELASVLVTKQANKTGQEDPNGGQVLAGFKGLNLLNFSGKPATRATLAVVIAPFAASGDKNADADNKALTSIASWLKQYGNGVLVAGNADAAANGGMIKAIRDDDKLKLSTVDTADIPSGQVTGVLALQNEVAGKYGDYGIGAGVDGPLPSPVPTVTKKK